ncbi:MAG: DMT family transporter [Dehalococcoidia bacterium]
MGEASALGAAVLWAFTSILLTSQARLIHPIPLSALRGLFASVFLVLVALSSGAIDELREMSANTALSMVGSGVVGMALGDTLYIASLGLLGAARTFPISAAAYPLLTFLLAASFLDEQVTVVMLLGAGLIVVGLWLLVSESGAGSERSARGSMALRGVAFALGAGALWALATIWLKLGSGDLGAVAAGSLRVPAAGLFLLGLTASSARRFEVRNYGGRSVTAVAAAGLLGMGVGSLLFIFSVQEAGAGKAAILSSTAPLYALPLSVLLLAERLTLKIVLGTIISIVGIWLVV